MHLNENGREKASAAERTRMIATLSVLAAISTILLVLGTLIAVNTIFFTALAAFIVGIVVVKYGFGAGCMLFIGCSLLDFLLNPDKLHVFLYLAMGGFTLLSEGSYKLAEKRIPEQKKRNLIHLLCRVIIFAAGYVPVVIFFPRLFVEKTALDNISASNLYLPVMIGVGIIAFLVYDLAYLFVKRTYMRMFGRMLGR